MGLNRTNALPIEQQVRIWERKLNKESVPADPINMMAGVHSTEKRTPITNEIFIKMEGGKNDQRFHRMVLQKTLSGAPTEGSVANPVGREEDLRQKIFDLFYTDWSHQVSLQEYGIEAINKDYWSIFEQINPQLALYAKQYDGKYMREALLERYSANLTAAPHFLNQEFSPNIAIAGLHSSQFPVFNNTPATWTNRIATGLVTAGVGAQASATIRFMQLVEEWASVEKVIEPVDVGGRETYVCLIPSPNARYLKDPVVAGNMGAAWRDYASLNPAELMFPGVLGRIGRCLIVEDPRYPTLTIGGTAGNYTLTPEYRLAGRDPQSDPRDKTLQARQVGYLLGKAALAKWQPEPFHWEYEYEQYKKFGGKGIFTSVGYQMVQWDFGNLNTDNPPTSLTRQQDSSVVLLFSNPPLLT